MSEHSIDSIDGKAGAEILIVDDTPANLDLLSDMLAERGYQVRAAINGEMALMSLKRSLPELILLDVNMPGLDGYEVCQRLKADEQTADIPVIFISALDQTLDKVKAFEVGGVDYITKPFQIEEVLARIRSQLTLYQQRQELQERYLQIQQLQNTLKSYLSGRTWEIIEQERYIPKWEPLSILVGDIAGFTTITEQADPGQLLADLSMYMSLVTKVVYDHEGEVDKFLGDGMLCYFNKAKFAFEAAQEVQRQVATFNQQQEKRQRFAFRTRLGLATGKVMLAQMGASQRREYTVIGDRVNVAARLQAQAPIGGLLMDEATYQALKQALEVELSVTASELSIRGKELSETVYTVSAADMARHVTH